MPGPAPEAPYQWQGSYPPQEPPAPPRGNAEAVLGLAAGTASLLVGFMGVLIQYWGLVALALAMVAVAAGVLGIRNVTTRRTSRLHGIAVGGVVVGGVGLVLGGVTTILEFAPSESDDVNAAVTAYARARADGDAAKACSFLTPGQQGELVARIKGIAGAKGSMASCRRRVLTVSDTSDLTDQNTVMFRDGDNWVRMYGDTACVRPQGSYDPALCARKVHGRWLLDQKAQLEQGFLASCSRRTAVSMCECIFDTLRAGSYKIFRQLAAEIRAGVPPQTNPALQQAATACGVG